MAFALDPVGNPLGFIGFFFIQNALVDPLTPLKLALYSSVLIFPFALIGRLVHSRLEKSGWLKGMKTAALWRLLAACFAGTLSFWLLTRLWTFAFYRELPAGAFFGIAHGILLGTITSALLAVTGNKLLKIMRKQWQMPSLLAVYIAELVMSAAFWVIVTAYVVISASQLLAV
ncbi:hypothetical protein HY546_01700 [archaeon]|nr:hypothetical protein [archaeon]